MRVRLRRQAAADAGEILAFLAAASPVAAERFAAALESATRRLATHPRIGHPFPTLLPRLRGMRTWPVPGFPQVLVLYIPGPHRVSVLRVLHGARDVKSELGEED